MSVCCFTKSFSSQDSAITSSLPVLDLVDSIKPGAVIYDNVGSGDDEEVCGVCVISVGVICASFKTNVFSLLIYF